MCLSAVCVVYVHVCVLCMHDCCAFVTACAAARNMLSIHTSQPGHFLKKEEKRTWTGGPI